MNILAIDPGNEQSAYIFYINDKIGEKAIARNAEVLQTVYDISPQCEVVIEMIAGYGMPVGKTVFDTCLWIGRFVEAAESRFIRTHLVYRKDIKLHFCGSTRAKDGNIRQALIDKLGPQGTKKNPGPTYGISKDIWSALAVAIYFREAL